MTKRLADHSYRFDLGDLKGAVHLRFADPGQLRRGARCGARPDGHAETVALNLQEIREGVCLNSWTEASGATVTHLEDFENGKFYSNVTVDGKLYHFIGTIKEA
ncbi:hypothetical protein B7755_000955 [Streptomyces sp. NBS 14/10]|uniref:MoaF-related domain-containing protein n=1 Tax=Streptomyces sp. NBS 14/10 TaxID=1945643 RepID=UPI00117CEC39|nr:hypothetical protein [Streptomyces sp. NBS 14/10]KAK1176886.1 hypothetical protein B7755_000955 [Streptomyces sp. NBS 14/10]